MEDFDRGIVVDARGFFVAALQWQKGTPRPNLGDRKVNGGLRWLLSEYALENVSEDARWDDTPVFADDGSQIRDGTWQFPTVQRWLVRQRRDKPRFWAYQRPVTIWPDRLPTLPAGTALVDVDPGAIPDEDRPIWDEQEQRWFYAQRRIRVDADGVCGNIEVAIEDSDVELAEGERLVDPDTITVTDELDETRPVEPGDVLNADNTVSRARPPRYRQIRVGQLIRVLQRRNLAAAFQTFIESKGFTVDQFRALGRVSLNNRVLREFVIEQGLSLKDARDRLEQDAVDQEEQDANALDSLGEEA